MKKIFIPCFFALSFYSGLALSSEKISDDVFYNRLPSYMNKLISKVNNNGYHKKIINVHVVNNRGLYLVNKTVCILGSCRSAAPTLTCYAGHNRLSGYSVGNSRVFSFNHHFSCLKVITANNKKSFSFRSYCYFNEFKNGHIANSINSLSISADGKDSFNVVRKVQRNFPLLDRDLVVYSHYQYRSRSCLVKKLPQLHHG